MQSEQDDWISCLNDSFGSQFCETLRTLSLNKLQKYPTPKLFGLPFGHEVRIFLRFLKGQSSLLDPSAFSKAYLFFASARKKKLYRAFILGESLLKSDWLDLIGKQNLNLWIEKKLFEERTKGKLSLRFRVISIGETILVVDFLNQTFTNRVHIGQDTINMIEFLADQKHIASRRYLDIGTGSGAILLQLSPQMEEVIGMDINPRAARLARLNVKLNLNHALIYEHDIFQRGEITGLFDLITWNMPFIFFPESEKDINVDGYGGHMGIELTLRFFSELPSLLSEEGQSWLQSSAPILVNGVNLLEDKLIKLADQLHLDISIFVMGSFWEQTLREFHKSHGIDRFENVFLKIVHGRGHLERIPPSIQKRTLDRVRGLLYNRYHRNLQKNF